jgi:hypothetical protein
VVGTGMDHLLISLDDPAKAYRAAVAAGGVPVRVYGGRTDAVRGPDGVNLVFTNGTPAPLPSAVDSSCSFTLVSVRTPALTPGMRRVHSQAARASRIRCVGWCST